MNVMITLALGFFAAGFSAGTLVQYVRHKRFVLRMQASTDTMRASVKDLIRASRGLMESHQTLVASTDDKTLRAALEGREAIARARAR